MTVPTAAVTSPGTPTGLPILCVDFSQLIQPSAKRFTPQKSFRRTPVTSQKENVTLNIILLRLKCFYQPDGSWSSHTTQNRESDVRCNAMAFLAEFARAGRGRRRSLTFTTGSLGDSPGGGMNGTSRGTARGTARKGRSRGACRFVNHKDFRLVPRPNGCSSNT